MYNLSLSNSLFFLTPRVTRFSSTCDQTTYQQFLQSLDTGENVGIEVEAGGKFASRGGTITEISNDSITVHNECRMLPYVFDKTTGWSDSDNVAIVPEEKANRKYTTSAYPLRIHQSG